MSSNVFERTSTTINIFPGKIGKSRQERGGRDPLIILINVLDESVSSVVGSHRDDRVQIHYVDEHRVERKYVAPVASHRLSRNNSFRFACARSLILILLHLTSSL